MTAPPFLPAAPEIDDEEARGGVGWRDGGRGWGRGREGEGGRHNDDDGTEVKKNAGDVHHISPGTWVLTCLVRV